jgi:predicted transcriptional regulator
MSNNNYFCMPNELWDLDLDIYERAILTHIVRKTVGWNKKSDGISLAQFSKDLQISKPKVIETIKSLIKRGLIEKRATYLKDGSRSYNVYSLKQNSEQKQEEEVVNEINRGSKRHLQGVVNDIDRQYNTNTKDTNNIKEKIYKKEKSKSKFEKFIQLLRDTFASNKILSLKAKINQTKNTREAFKAVEGEDLEALANEYTLYVLRNKNYSVRLDRWLVAYSEGSLNLIDYARRYKKQSEERKTYKRSTYDVIDSLFDKLEGITGTEQVEFIDAEVAI